MIKPLINLDETNLVELERHGPFFSSSAEISERIGAKRLSYTLTVLEPGGKVCPYHSHHIGEEMFLILEGNGTLRFGESEYSLRALDIIACPPGGAEVAHQIINTGTNKLKYLSLSTKDSHDVCEYPDSQKLGLFFNRSGQRYLRKLFKINTEVDYFEGELR